MSLVTRRLLIEGRVQGVGFRWSLHAEALRLGLHGWVRNRSDGRVEALIRGEEDAVEMLTAWAHRGPEMARVMRVYCTEEPTESLSPEGQFIQKATY